MTDEDQNLKDKFANAKKIANQEKEAEEEKIAEQKKEAKGFANERMKYFEDMNEDPEPAAKSIAPKKKLSVSLSLPLEINNKIRDLVGYNGDISYSAVIKKLLDGLKEYSTDNPELVKERRFIKTYGNKVKTTITLTEEEENYIKSWIGQNGLTTVGNVVELAFKVANENNL